MPAKGEWRGLPVIAPLESKLSRPSCLPAACDLLPGGHPKAAGTTAGLLLHSCLGPQGPRGTERRIGGAAVVFWAPRTPLQSCSGTGRASGLSGSFSISPGPRVRRAQRTATRAGLPRGGAPGPPARTLRCWRPETRARLASPPARLLGRAPRLRPQTWKPERTAAPCPASGIRCRRLRCTASDAPRGPPQGGEKRCLRLQQ